MGRRNLKCDECGTPMIWLDKNEWDEDEWNGNVQTVQTKLNGKMTISQKVA